MPTQRPPLSRVEFEDELELLIQQQRRRDRDRSEDLMTRRWDTTKTVLPWIIAVAAFLWNAGGTWAGVTGTSGRLDALEKSLKTDYVSAKEFQLVASQVADIHRMLLEERRAKESK